MVVKTSYAICCHQYHSELSNVNNFERISVVSDRRNLDFAIHHVNNFQIRYPSQIKKKPNLSFVF